MSYTTNLKSFSRVKIWYVELDLDFCSNTYGNAPCTASVGVTGLDKCYNTYPHCQDTTNYVKGVKTYRFSSHDTPLPFSNNERPYIQDITQLPTEIKTDKFTVKGRIKVKMLNEPDNDVGIDPYVSDRSAIQGRFWHKLVRRNINYKGRTIRVYEGFSGDTQAEYQQRFAGTIDNITFSNSGVTIEGVDYIADISKVKIPYKYDISLGKDILATDTSITFSGDDVDTLGGQSTGKTLYIKVNDEVMQYQSSDYDSTANSIAPIIRGFKNSKTTSHSEDDKVVRVAHYGPGNAFNIMQRMLTNAATDDEPGAGISTAKINLTAFATWRDWLGNDTTLEIQTEGFFPEDVQLDEAYFGLVSLYDSKSWVGEDLKITVRRNVPNLPGRDMATITDSAHIALDSDGFDMNEPKRFTRKYVFWNWNLVDDDNKIASFTRRNAFVGAEEESSVFYDEMIEDTTFQMWLSATMDASTSVEKFARDSVAREFAHRRRARPIVTFETEIKDSTILTGDYTYLNSDVIENIDGTPVRGIYQVLKREVRDNKIKYTAEEQRANLVAYITSSTVAGAYPSSFDTATEKQQREGGWIADSSNVVGSTRQPAYHIY